MEAYQHILLAADFTAHCDRVARRAADLAGIYQSKLSVCHAVDSLPIAESVYGPIIPFDGDLTAELVAAAEKQLAILGATYGIPEDRQWVVIGSPKTEILLLAEEHKTDLIVVGSHGRHGLGLLLGSTASSILHHAKCDVMAVRLTDAGK
ncbi:MAG: universal stress protein [Methylococcaceae bacterium]|nr:universal stress protein [Methylococcaceae bacterium]MCI0734298.1 universal stress protein [Methylococcaceae bacterium]